MDASSLAFVPAPVKSIHDIGKPAHGGFAAEIDAMRHGRIRHATHTPFPLQPVRHRNVGGKDLNRTWNKWSRHQMMLFSKHNESQNEDDVFGSDPDSKGEEKPDTSMTNLNKRKLSRDMDRLPFEVMLISPGDTESRFLGKFMLDPATVNGDMVEHDGNTYVVRKVIFHYTYKEGKFVVYKKTIEVKSLARKALEAYLNQLYQSS